MICIAIPARKAEYLRFEVNLKRIDQGQQPRQQRLVQRMGVVSFERSLVVKEHRSAKFVALRAWRNVGADMRHQ